MDIEAMPIIRLELNHMKQSMLSHLGLHNNEMTDAVETALTKAIESFDFTSVVSTAANSAIEETIDNYFKFGEGRNFIKDTLEKAFMEMMKGKGGT